MTESEKFLDKIMSLVDSDDKHFFRCHKADIKAYAKIYHKEQLTLTDVKRSSCEHKAKVLTKEEVEQGRSNAYKYLDIKQ
jgi:hypothetical protein